MLKYLYLLAQFLLIIVGCGELIAHRHQLLVLLLDLVLLNERQDDPGLEYATTPLVYCMQCTNACVPVVQLGISSVLPVLVPRALEDGEKKRSEG